MANVGDRTDLVGPFTSSITTSKEVDPGRDTEVLSRELVDFLKRFRQAVLADLREAQAQINTKT